MAESRKSPKKVTEKWKKTEKVPESRKKHLGGNRKMPLSSHGKPEKWEFCGKRKEKLDASQQTEIAGKISCPEKIFPAASGSFFYCFSIIQFRTCQISNLTFLHYKIGNRLLRWSNDLFSSVSFFYTYRRKVTVGLKVTGGLKN